jgi:hypothetical protein
MITGYCNCKSVTFTVTGPIQGPSICHCGQCRRQSGHQWASAYAPETQIEITGEVRWYASSPTAKRGFCPTCGSFLFWKHNDEDTLSFALGAIDTPTGITLEKHIFVADKGDYYDIADGLPQKEQ